MGTQFMISEGMAILKGAMSRTGWDSIFCGNFMPETNTISHFWSNFQFDVSIYVFFWRHVKESIVPIKEGVTNVIEMLNIYQHKMNHTITFFSLWMLDVKHYVSF